MPEIERIDVSAMFCDYESADATRDGDMALVRLHQGGTYATMRLRVSEIYQALENLRKQKPGRR